MQIGVAGRLFFVPQIELPQQHAQENKSKQTCYLLLATATMATAMAEMWSCGYAMCHRHCHRNRKLCTVSPPKGLTQKTKTKTEKEKNTKNMHNNGETKSERRKMADGDGPGGR